MGARGFTLVEILMVIVLVGIISAVALPSFIDFRDDARTAATNDRLTTIRSAIVGDGRNNRSGFITHIGSPPSSLNALAVRGSLPTYDPINKTGWNGPYVDATVTDWDRDAWGTAFAYDLSGRTLRSCGKNRTCGDSDDLTVRF